MSERERYSRARSRRARALILSALNEVYIFPQSERALLAAITELKPDLTERDVRAGLTYLEKKGYATIHNGPDGERSARVSSDGVDLAEGAARDRGIAILKFNPRELRLKRALRHSILSYLSWFPESYSSDDEMLDEFQKSFGLTPTLDQIRFGIWYLFGKSLIEMKTRHLFGDFIYLARITARGIDILDGTESDPGVARDG